MQETEQKKNVRKPRFRRSRATAREQQANAALFTKAGLAMLNQYKRDGVVELPSVEGTISSESMNGKLGFANRETVRIRGFRRERASGEVRMPRVRGMNIYRLTINGQAVLGVVIRGLHPVDLAFKPGTAAVIELAVGITDVGDGVQACLIKDLQPAPAAAQEPAGDDPAAAQSSARRHPHMNGAATAFLN